MAYYWALAEAGLNSFIAGVYRNDIETVCLLAEQVPPVVSAG